MKIISKCKANLKKMFASGPSPSKIFFQSKLVGILTIFFSCLSSYSLMLDMISALFVFLIVFYFYLKWATCISVFSLLQICISINVHIDIPGHSSCHLLGVSVSFLHAANGCVNTTVVVIEIGSVNSACI